MKRMLIMLCAALLLAAPMFLVQAEEPALTRDDALVQEVRQLYKDCLRASGRESFFGMCGLATSYQLWKLGINQELEVHDGNKQFDSYKDRKVTTGGHDIQAYSAKDYSLTEALNLVSRNGTRSVRNILVGFQWTDTAAGAAYGHACVINAIQDGTVYFTESFNYAFGKLEGQTITCTIDQFEDFFDGWTTYEGIIYFGTKQYANSCQSQGTDLYVQLRFDSNLRSQPCLLGQNDCVRLRSLQAGELLHATAVYVSAEGDVFYRIDDGGVTGYVSANAVHLQQRNVQVTLENADIPMSIEPGEDPKLAGGVEAPNCQITGLQLQIKDETDTVILQAQADVRDGKASLGSLNEQLTLNTLAAGSYQLTLTAAAAYAVAEGMELLSQTVSQTLICQILCVGTAEVEAVTEETETTPDGWFLKNDTWYCYENGQPCTGWVTRIGVDYYLKDDGSVTTGWMEEAGWIRYFSATGALCDGWVTTAEGTYYWIGDGVMATGLQQIEEKVYWFAEDGLLGCGGTVTVDDALYTVNPDGTAVPVE